MNRLPPDTVRGRVRGYLERNAGLLRSPVLEVGSRLPRVGAWWADFRGLAPGAEWIGIDMQDGVNVDFVVDAHRLGEIDRKFGAALCAEMLEHVENPQLVIEQIRDVLEPGAWALFTTLQSFPVHGYPDDYWRFTEHGLRLLLESAGFEDVKTEAAGEVVMRLNDHGDGEVVESAPVHVFAKGRKS